MDPENDGFGFIEISWAYQLFFIIGSICIVHAGRILNQTPQILSSLMSMSQNYWALMICSTMLSDL